MATEFAEWATSDSLTGPDREMNIEVLCNIINQKPGQANGALKVLKRRLGDRSPKVQLLALNVLEALSRNCGASVRQQIVAQEILYEMVKIVKKRPDINVREKILVLIDAWQTAFKEAKCRDAYHALKAAGVEFPPRIENNAPPFTPPQSHPVAYGNAAIRTSNNSKGPSLPRIPSLPRPRLPSEENAVHNDSTVGSEAPANPSLTHSLSLRSPRRN